ncbi:MAG: arginyl-tRNA synthetase [Myxococcota bacterium]|jgi:arginyl-tRNA synthetase
MSVPTVPDVLTALVVEAADAAGFAGVIDDIEPAAPTSNPSFGDYQSNHAFRIGRARRTNPRAVAQQVAAKLSSHPAVARVEVAGPGYINFYLDDAWIAQQLTAQVLDPDAGVPQVGEGRTLVIDYSSPNIAKRMHIGHMRSTIIGNTLLRLYQAAGWRTIADNHIGDWGTPIGKLIVAWNGWRDDDKLAADPIGELERLYVSFGKRAKEDPSLAEQAREETAKLQSGDAGNLALWQRFMEISRQERDAIYDRLGASFDVTHGESFYNDVLGDIIDNLLAAGVAKKSEGAVIVAFSEEAEPKMLRDTALVIRKQDGAALYGTTDVATLEHRVATWDPDLIVYVTDNRQQLHFQQFFSAWNQWRAVRGETGLERPELVHTYFGTLKINNATLSTREGNSIRLADLLDEAEQKARAVVDEASPHLSEEERAAIARGVGISSVRYFDLSQKPQSDVNFTWDKVLAMQGNSAPFLMYSYARSRSIQRRCEVTDPSPEGIVLGEEAERALAVQLLQFPSAVQAALETQRPNLLCKYLFETAGALNRFVATCRVLGSDEQGSRIALLEATCRVLGKGLGLLGIEALDRM